ncbi:methyltransferase [Gemmata sp. JC717]|uniref:acetylserotonin O-methyltransferase n=1 Tax=Gemmata algarum TaxID=2975278 RepID=UPI0021BB1989|nr:acetylserotonin O-methyltransferase [Gemmata algarum]MDY3553472.1 methyltransferase [Gemmata algarum]
MPAPQSPEPLPPHAVLMQLVFGKLVTQAVSVVARFKLADQMAAGPKTAAELASAAGLNANHLYRVLRALAGLGVLSAEGERFALTPVGEFLRSDVPGSMRAIATYVCDPWSWKPWGDLAGSVKAGAPVFDRMFGEGVFDYLAKHPDEAATFNEGMTGFSQQAAATMLKAYDFTPFGTIVDVGGGHGAILRAVLGAAPSARGIVFDAPQVAAGADEPIRAAGLADRCKAEGGDFFQSVPAGGDLYILKHIIHDWNDAKATQILKSVRAAIPATGKLLLVEMVVPPGFAPHFAHVLDLEMMVVCDGKERTEQEYRELLARAGFRLTRIVPTEGPHGLIEAEPV